MLVIASPTRHSEDLLSAFVRKQIRGYPLKNELMFTYLGLSSFESLSSLVPAFHYKSAAKPLHKNLQRVFHFNRAAFEQSNYIEQID